MSSIGFWDMSKFIYFINFTLHLSKKELEKRLLALALSTMLAVSMVPNVSAFAQETGIEMSENTEQSVEIPHFKNVAISTQSVDVTAQEATITAEAEMGNGEKYERIQLNYACDSNNDLEKATTTTIISSQRADSRMDFFRHKSVVKLN